MLLLLLCHASVQPLRPARSSDTCVSCSPTWTFGLLSGSGAEVGLAVGSATDDIIIDAPPRVLRLNVLLAARLLLLLLVGLPTGITKAPAEEAP